LYIYYYFYTGPNFLSINSNARARELFSGPQTRPPVKKLRFKTRKKENEERQDKEFKKRAEGRRWAENYFCSPFLRKFRARAWDFNRHPNTWGIFDGNRYPMIQIAGRMEKYDGMDYGTGDCVGVYSRGKNYFNFCFVSPTSCLPTFPPSSSLPGLPDFPASRLPPPASRLPAFPPGLPAFPPSLLPAFPPSCLPAFLPSPSCFLPSSFLLAFFPFPAEGIKYIFLDHT
jgi:hypothetical protein